MHFQVVKKTCFFFNVELKFLIKNFKFSSVSSAHFFKSNKPFRRDVVNLNRFLKKCPCYYALIISLFSTSFRDTLFDVQKPN